MELREILRQLAEKKISVEEAYRKINEGEREREPLKIAGVRIRKKQERVDEKHGEVGVHIPAEKKGYGFRITGGRIRFKTGPSDSLSIKGYGDYQLSKEKITLRGDFEVEIPPLIAVSINAVSCEISGEIDADVFNLAIQDSNISLSVDSRIVNLSNQGGDSDVRLTGRLKVLNVSNKLGMLKIGLPRSLRGIFNLKEHQGEITVEGSRGKRIWNLLAGSGAPAVINISAHNGAVRVYYDTGRKPDKDIQEQGTGDTGS